jgi:hypothetical protein
MASRSVPEIAIELCAEADDKKVRATEQKRAHALVYKTRACAKDARVRYLRRHAACDDEVPLVELCECLEDCRGILLVVVRTEQQCDVA